VEYVGFKLKPNNFFNGNPAMDLPPSRDHASVLDGQTPGCCKKNA
jgi:primary-amine oxidase